MVIRRALAVSFFISILILHTSILYAMGTLPPHKRIPLRVLVLKDTREITLRIKGRYKMLDFDTGGVLEEGESLRKKRFFVDDISSKGIKIISVDRARIYVNNRQFRGEIDIIKTSDRRALFVVNHIDLEEYLYGVLYHEVSHYWPMEVLKAQAIVARTYALYEKLTSKNRYFDLTSDVYSQVYGGRTSERWRTTRAVNLTQGHVLTYKGKIFPTYYHATCGGRTSDADTIWDIDMEPLKGKDCGFCSFSPHYKWKKELTIEYVEERLKKAGYRLNIVSIEVLTRDAAGRVLDMALKGKDSDVKLSGNKFRLAVGPNIIKSTNFEISIKGRYITFHGRGWGHGIGMCQWGAYGMARKGWKVDDILGYYYPKTEILSLE